MALTYDFIYKKIKNQFLLVICVLVVGACSTGKNLKETEKPLNILMIIVDDQDASLNSLRHNLIKTPAFDKLAKSSTVFYNAYCAAPACGPSRTALLTGVAPHKTGVFYNGDNLWAANNSYVSISDLPKYLKDQGYTTAGLGKVYHHGAQSELTKSNWTDGYFMPYDVGKNLALKDVVVSRTEVFSDMWSIGHLPDTWDLNDTIKTQQDTYNTNRAIQILNQKHERPFFITLGIFKPHVPYYVAERYFDLYPLDSIDLPDGYLENDLIDVPDTGRWIATNRRYHEYIRENDLWKSLIQANMASISYADEQLGRVLEALKNSRYNDNTMIIFVGDNGFHIGEKDHWSKFALWEKATRVPFLISLPGQQESQFISKPVSLLDIYPTIVDLCGSNFGPSHHLDGISLKEMIEDKAIGRNAPVIVTYGKNCHAIISEAYYYIHYANGEEELYDQRSDPHQWTNLASEPQHRPTILKFREWLPEENADRL